MRTVEKFEWKTWSVAVAGALVLNASVVSLFHFDPPVSAIAAPPPKVASIGFRPIPGSESELMDQAALFLRNRSNARQETGPSDTVQRPGDAFSGPYGAKLSMGEAVTLSLPPAAPAPETPLEVLAGGPQSTAYTGFGRSQVVVPQAPGRDPVVQVYSVADGKLAWELPVRNAGIPPVPAAWKPLEFAVVVDRIGLAGDPFLTLSSTFAAVDSHFQNYLKKELRIGARLDPGNYRIRIEP